MLTIKALMKVRLDEHVRKSDLYFKKQLSQDDIDKENKECRIQMDRWSQEYKILKKVDDIQMVKEVLIGLVVFAVLFYLLQVFVFE